MVFLWAYDVANGNSNISSNADLFILVVCFNGDGDSDDDFVDGCANIVPKHFTHLSFQLHHLKPLVASQLNAAVCIIS